MSLFLRKACQKVLDGVSLDNYHIQVDESTKCLEIVGECGDTLVLIAGIRLSRMAPSNDEIKLALSLFDDFLAKHTVTFNEFTLAKIHADKAPIPTAPSELKTAVMDKNSYQDFYTLKFKLTEIKGSAYVTSSGPLTYQITDIDLIENTKGNLIKVLTRDEEKAIRKWVKEMTDFRVFTAIKDKALEKLASCEI